LRRKVGIGKKSGRGEYSLLVMLFYVVNEQFLPCFISLRFATNPDSAGFYPAIHGPLPCK
jgi:hypothetical protein